MAKTREEQKSIDMVHPMTESDPTLRSVDDRNEVENTDPLTFITSELQRVARGGSMVELRRVMQEQMLKLGASGAVDLYNQLVRLRDASEQLVNHATEVRASLER